MLRRICNDRNIFDLTGQQNIPRSNTQSHGGGNFGDISDREIDHIAPKIGLDWERIGTFLDYESNQIDDLKHIYRDQVTF